MNICKNFFQNLFDFFKKKVHIEQNPINIAGTAMNLVIDTQKKINQFEHTFTIFPIENLSDIHWVYMDSIIINLAKLISATEFDKTGLKQLKAIAQKTIKNKMITLEKNCHDSDWYPKIKPNRSRLTVHTDISQDNSYTKMLFSKNHIYTLIKNLKMTEDSEIKTLEKIIAQNKDNERYMPEDLKADIPEIKLFLDDLLHLTMEILIYYTKKNNIKNGYKT